MPRFSAGRGALDASKTNEKLFVSVLAEARLPDRGRDVDADAALVADVDDVALQGEQRADLRGRPVNSPDGVGGRESDSRSTRTSTGRTVDLGDRARRRRAPARHAIDADRLGSNARVECARE